MALTVSAGATLVLGGARSGKSAFAESLVSGSGLDPVYLATAAAGDDEMAARIADHRARRGAEWITIEEQHDLASAVNENTGPGRMLLVDCLTLWLSNRFFAGADLPSESTGLCAAIGRRAGPLVLVSNEVGFGLVPETRLSRDFRDAQGRLNQAVAAVCDQVVMVVAGLPLTLKPTASGHPDS